VSNLANYLVGETLNDGTEVTIRAIQPDDKERLVEAFLHLQPRTIRMRFFYAKKSLTENELDWVDKVAQGRHVGLVATVTNAGKEMIVAEGSYVGRDHSAEIEFTVAEPWQRRGIATCLLQRLAGSARAQGIHKFEADVLVENEAMLAVFRRSGFPMTTRLADGQIHVTLDLDSRAASR
jgi:RimJ/RimL family protein N-acetyltransferase